MLLGQKRREVHLGAINLAIVGAVVAAMLHSGDVCTGDGEIRCPWRAELSEYFARHARRSKSTVSR